MVWKAPLSSAPSSPPSNPAPAQWEQPEVGVYETSVSVVNLDYTVAKIMSLPRVEELGSKWRRGGLVAEGQGMGEWLMQ